MELYFTAIKVLPGERTLLPFPLEGVLIPGNDILYNDVGILIESGGDPGQTIPSDPEILGNIPDGEGGFFLVVRAPRPVNESTPVFVRLKYQTTDG